MRCRCRDIERANLDLNKYIPRGITQMGRAQQAAANTAARISTVSGHISSGVYAGNIGAIVAEIMDIITPVNEAIDAVQERFGMARESIEIKRGMFRTEDSRFHAAQEAERLARQARIDQLIQF